ncbi:MAG: hypothetical protein JSV31_30065 [Desulfobacterales bacterium]|nr:MAG: hypothetical protein JSV31_30065 [Desulfobacterales bacterium]
MKQIDDKAVSTEESMLKIEGFVVGDQLKGKIINPIKTYPFTIKISSDGLYFNGASTDYYGRSLLIRGTRKTPKP